MKTTARVVALLLSTVLLVGAPAAFQAASAKPALKLSTIKTAWGAKQQACKKSVAHGKNWRVYTRVVNGRKAEVGVGLMVNKGDKTVAEFRTPIMKKGKTSKIGSVVIPQDDAEYTLSAFQFQGQMGDGGPVDLKKIRAC
jgi:hypothetical protein